MYPSRSHLLILVDKSEFVYYVNSNLAKECDCMAWLYLMVIIFSALTLYFTYGEYKQNKFSKKAFTLVSIMEAVAIVATAVMLIMSL